MGIETALLISAVAAAAGTGYGIHQNQQAGAAAGRAAGDARNRSIQQTVQRQQNIQAIREAYGVGDSAAAKQAAQSINKSANDYYQTSLQKNLEASENAYAGSSRASRQNLARVGQLGSGLDANAQAGNLSDYLRSRQRAISSAAGARDSLLGSLTAQRQGFENQVSGGTMANPDINNIAAQRESTLAQAQANVAPAAIGDLFRTAGNTYFQGRTQEAQGNQGLAAFGLANQNNAGRIS